MDVVGALQAGRAAHLALMLDTCLITRGGGEPVWDPGSESGAGYTIPESDTVYTGPCRVKPWTAGFETQAGERPVALRQLFVALPQDTAALIEVGDTLTVTASTDAWLVGRPLAVTVVELGTTRTARWITVEDQRG